MTCDLQDVYHRCGIILGVTVTSPVQCESEITGRKQNRSIWNWWYCCDVACFKRVRWKKKNVLEVCRTIIVYDLMYSVTRLLSISLHGICKPFNSWLRSTCNFSPKHPFLIQQTGDENMQTNQAEVVILI